MRAALTSKAAGCRRRWRAPELAAKTKSPAEAGLLQKLSQEARLRQPASLATRAVRRDTLRLAVFL
jgi:hypothetical protein